jgi:transcriptional regulator of heat shock response
MIENLEQLAKILEVPSEKQIQLSNLFLEFLKTKEAQDLINTTEETLLSKFRIHFPEDLTIIKDLKDECIVKFQFDDEEEEIVSIKEENQLYNITIKIKRESKDSNMNYKASYVNVKEDKLITILRASL